MNKPDPRLVAIGRALYANRAARGLSTRQLAAELKLTYSTISRIENAANSPDLPTLLTILDYLGLTGTFLGPKLTEAEAYRRGWNDCAAAIRSTLDRVPTPTEGEA